MVCSIRHSVVLSFQSKELLQGSLLVSSYSCFKCLVFKCLLLLHKFLKPAFGSFSRSFITSTCEQSGRHFQLELPIVIKCQLVICKVLLFYVGPDCFVVRNVFLSVFLVDLLLQYQMGKSTHSRLDVSASLGFLQQ